MDFPTMIQYGMPKRKRGGPGDPEWEAEQRGLVQGPATSYSSAPEFASLMRSDPGGFNIGEPSQPNYAAANSTSGDYFDLMGAMVPQEPPASGAPRPKLGMDVKDPVFAALDPNRSFNADGGFNIPAPYKPAMMAQDPYKTAPGSADPKGGSPDLPSMMAGVPTPVPPAPPAAPAPAAAPTPRKALKYYSGATEWGPDPILGITASPTAMGTEQDRQIQAAIQARGPEFVEKLNEWRTLSGWYNSPAEAEAAMNAPKPAPLTAPRPFQRVFDNGLYGGGKETFDMLEMPDGTIRRAGTMLGRDGLPRVENVGQPNLVDQLAGNNAFYEQQAKAQAAADPKVQARLMETDLSGKYGVQEAEARRKDVMNTKLMEAALFNQQRTFEATGDERAAKDAFDRTMRIAGSALPPGMAAAAGSMPPGAAGPQAPRSMGPSKMQVDSLSKLVEGKASLSPDDATGILDSLASLPEEAVTPELLSRLVGASPNRDALMDAIVKRAAGDWTMLGLGGTGPQSPSGTDFLGGPAALLGGLNRSSDELPSRSVDDRFGLPFNLVRNNRPWDISRAVNSMTGKPEALYNQAVLPNGRIVALDQGDLVGSLGKTLASDADRAAAERRVVRAKRMLEYMLGIQPPGP